MAEWEEEMKEIIIFLIAGAFVYLGLGIYDKFGAEWYFLLVMLSLIIGYFLR